MVEAGAAGQQGQARARQCRCMFLSAASASRSSASKQCKQAVGAAPKRMRNAGAISARWKQRSCLCSCCDWS